MLGEAIDESDEAGGAGEYAPPFLEGQVGRDDGGGSFMAPADDLEEEVDGALVYGHISKFVAYEKIDIGIALHASLDGGQRLLFQEIGERRNDRGKADGHAGAERGEAYVLRKHGLTHTAWAAKKDVLAALHEAQAQDILA